MWLFEKWMAMMSIFIAVSILEGQGPAVRPFSDETEGCRNDCFCVSRDGKKLALNHWTIWDIPTGKLLLVGHTRGGSAINFSPDGRLLAVGGNYSELFIYDARTGKEVWNLTLVGHADSIVNHAEFTPDGRFLVSSSSNGMLLRLGRAEQEVQSLFCFTSKYDVKNGWKQYLEAWRSLAGNKPPDGVQNFVVFDKPVDEVNKFSLSPDGKLAA